MKIGIEAQRIFRKNKHGMDYVVLEEIKVLQMIDKENEYYIFVRPGEDRCVSSTPNFHVVELRCPTYPLWEQVALPLAVKSHHIDLLHCTSNTAPLYCPVKLVLTLHDIIFLEKRDKSNHSLYQNMGWIYRRLIVPRILHHCKSIITVSDYERKNIISRLSLPEELVVRIYNGYNVWFNRHDTEEKNYLRYIDQKGYFFFFGNTDPKKNTERTIRAYARYLKQSGQKRRLLLADFSKTHLEEILHRYNIETAGQYITVTDYIVNKDLPSVYHAAFAVLYTSLRESFGIPLLEAMACGTPVVTSNTSSMPEIGGKQAALVNPYQIEDITKMMLRLEQDNTFYARQKSWGLERARIFSWEKTGHELLDLYKRL